MEPAKHADMLKSNSPNIGVALLTPFSTHVDQVAVGPGAPDSFDYARLWQMQDFKAGNEIDLDWMIEGLRRESDGELVVPTYYGPTTVTYCGPDYR